MGLMAVVLLSRRSCTESVLDEEPTGRATSEGKHLEVGPRIVFNRYVAYVPSRCFRISGTASQRSCRCSESR